MRLPKKSSRRFSKWMLVINGALAWAAVFYAINRGQAEAVAASGLGLIGILYSAYVGIGHADFRKVLEASKTILRGDDEAG
ncbi:hypothetical protein GCM10023174_10130 [Chelativorans composti]|uniref:Uncharacterized protein n=1 Tax=Chelativorans composti TaxID=768533 RepID=A0ABW5DP61_9HYPH